jgi:hypothetical protein
MVLHHDQKLIGFAALRVGPIHRNHNDLVKQRYIEGDVEVKQMLGG